MPDGLATETASDLVRRAMHEYESPLVGYAAGILGDVDLARDAVQDTFLKLYEQEPSRIGGAGLKSWLYTVCRNKAFDILRRRKRLVSIEDDSVGELTSPDPSPADTAAGGEDSAEVLRFLRRLPANQQEVLQLKFQRDLSYKEISGLTGLSVSNVGFLIHTGLKRLRQLLSHEAPLAAAAES